MSIMLVDCNLPRYCTRSDDNDDDNDDGDNDDDNNDDDDDDLYDSYVNHQNLVIHTVMY